MDWDWEVVAADRQDVIKKVDVHASAGVWAPTRGDGHLAKNQGSFATADSNVPIPGVTKFPVITSDVTNEVQ
jgi:hypothetical protein